MNVYFEMCVNDYDGYGQHTGRLHAACFRPTQGYDKYLALTCTWLNEHKQTTVRRVGDDKLRVGRRVFPILGYRCYVGNIMWDAALVSAEVASQIADYLRGTGKYDPESGMLDAWMLWEQGMPLLFG